MPTIIVINNCTEQMLGQRLNQRQASFAAKAALRNVWLARPGDIVVSTATMPEDFMSYVTRVSSFAAEAGDIAFFRPESDGALSFILQDEYLARPQLIEALRARVTRPEEWSLLACYQTAGTARLQFELGLAKAGGEALGRNFAASMGTNLLNRKSHFRQLAIGCSLPLPDGAIATSANSLLRAVTELLSVTGRVIVKQDNGAGGTGNFILSTSPTGPLPGACACVALPCLRRSDIESELGKLWDEWQAGSPGPMVVEAYHAATAMFYLEFFIAPEGQAHFMNSGTIRVRPHDDPTISELFWVGLELPAHLPPATLAEASMHCSRFLQLAATMGYRGHINIDAIVTENGRLLFNEVNARWGGGTVLHDLGTRLIGPDFTNTHVAASFRDVPSPSFGRLIKLLQESQIAYDPAQQQGIVVLACDDEHSHSFEALVLARSRDGARGLEQRLVEVLESKRAAEG
ncbi:preATP grasp domain-containing protein [Bradyrhizobium ottawaense]|uniref:preATP grasp domain-containing protein n=1 Tax=Bradyrhizobium ottawaense TaxID=931866 RepID=UPI003837BCCD